MNLSNWRYLSPSHYVDALFSRLAPRLRVHLAHAPLIWGDASRLSKGKNVHLVDAIINLRSGHVTIGDNSFLGHGVMLLTGKHDIAERGAARHASVPKEGRDITIGQGVWIASGAIIVGPCEIGDNAVIGAGVVVTGHIEANTICTGMPPRQLKALEYSSDAKDA
ncbi:MAG: acyltransferase [Rhizobiales bacterium]|nr:acyltransferase [Hyphomicrobiales bacterium]MBO6698972.1 acyltransferase [Hyphomicrobiales bacterium]MBO6734775.1 acyltransferase [Hyphomicrobiales bacterium]MBO6911419.1 acyltransferase [Hyphomicrobiales bacterium]MBO6955448.1 acyltransferase [Hyphomicrobiales bacterium]